jgi:CRP/FNR family transcriptional regulator
MHGSRKVVNITRLRQACRTCSLMELCLPMGLTSDDILQLEDIVHVKGPLERGGHLFREGDAFQAIYAVRDGAMKTYRLDPDGREHVLGFHLPGELLGLDAIYPRTNCCSASALAETSVCVLPFSQLAELAQKVPGLQATILRLMSKDLSVSANLATDHTAEERLAGFLLSIAQRTGAGTELKLVMPRRDIASYLRLATETVSRLLARFQQENLLEVHRKQVRIIDLDALRELGGCFELMDRRRQRTGYL